jgi:hypothetical protein
MTACGLVPEQHGGNAYPLETHCEAVTDIYITETARTVRNPQRFHQAKEYTCPAVPFKRETLCENVFSERDKLI